MWQALKSPFFPDLDTVIFIFPTEGSKTALKEKKKEKSINFLHLHEGNS